MIYIESEAEPEGSIETIVGVYLELSDDTIAAIRQASAVLQIHESFDHIQLHIQTAFGENKSKLVTKEGIPTEWRYDTEVIRIYGNTFNYRAQGKWDSNDLYESTDFEVKNLNKQTIWID